MRRVFPRRNLRLLCCDCCIKGKVTTAEVQGKTVALCWKCLEIRKNKKEKRKKELTRSFNEVLGFRIEEDNEE